jgi:hypothetical protein
MPIEVYQLTIEAPGLSMGDPQERHFQLLSFARRRLFKASSINGMYW